jgi:hypothetical protein
VGCLVVMLAAVAATCSGAGSSGHSGRCAGGVQVLGFTLDSLTLLSLLLVPPPTFSQLDRYRVS